MIWKYSSRNVNFDLKKINEGKNLSTKLCHKQAKCLICINEYTFMCNAEYNHMSPSEWTLGCVKNTPSHFG